MTAYIISVCATILLMYSISCYPKIHPSPQAVHFCCRYCAGCCKMTFATALCAFYSLTLGTCLFRKDVLVLCQRICMFSPRGCSFDLSSRQTAVDNLSGHVHLRFGLQGSFLVANLSLQNSYRVRIDLIYLDIS